MGNTLHKTEGKNMGKRLLAALTVFVTMLTVVAVAPVSAAPNSPASVTATLVGTNAIDAAWTAPAAGEVVATYTVELLDDVSAVVDTFTTADNADFDHRFLLVAPGDYTVLVRANNIDGPSPGLESAPAVTVPDVPGAPAAPSVSLIGVDGIKVDWATPADTGGSPVTGYEVTLTAVSGGPAPATVTVGAVLTLTFTTLPDGVYTAAVVAANAVGDSTSSPASASIEIDDPDAPDTPAAPTLTALSATEIQVDWVAPAANGSALIDYDVVLTPTAPAGTPIPQIIAHPTLTTSFTTLAPGTYTATVLARNGVGDSATSASSTPLAIGDVPDPPQAVSAGSPTVNTVQVAFSPPADNGGSAVTGYVVTATPLGGGSAVSSPSVGGSPVVVTGLASGTTYDFTVVATNAFGDSAASAAARATTIGVPTAPSAVVATRTGSTSAEVAFTAPSSNGGAAITDYTVTATADDLALPTVQASGASSPIAVTGLSLRATYTFTVVATNSVGDSPASSPSAGVFFPDSPVVPCCVTVENLTPYNSTVTIEWGAPTDNGGSAIIDYTVTVAGQTQTVASSVFSLTFTGVAVGQHTPTVTARNAGGTSGAATGPEVEVRAFAPFKSEQAFIRQLYRDFLGREADAPGLAYWTGVLADDGSNTADVTRSFMFSPEFNPRRSITRLYLAFFDRAPDLGGFDYWAGQINSGQASLDTISQSFVMSPEFVSTYGSLSDQNFIRLVYNNVLIRQPDQAGYDFWLGRMASGMTRGQLMTQFSESPEFVNSTRPAVDVIVTYRGMLDREPDPQGFSFWLTQIANNSNAIVSLINGFYNSPEYAGRIIP